MSNHLELAIETALAQVAALEAQVADHKRTVNGLCRLLSRPPMFPDIDPATHTPLRDDQFYGKPLATAVQAVLERRKSGGQGSATVADIYDMLVRGGFHFATKNAENAKRNLYMALSKNSKFHKLPNGTYGLTEWYPNLRKGREEEPEGEEEPKKGSLSQEDQQELAEARKAFDSEPQDASRKQIGGKKVHQQTT